MSEADVHAHRLTWMSPFAPYTPVAAVGLLEVLDRADPGATIAWEAESGQRPSLILRSRLDLIRIADEIAGAPWPQLDALPWTATPGQAIKPTLATYAREHDDDLAAAVEWRSLAGFGEAAPPSDQGLRAAQQLISALLTDAVLDGSNLPGRNRLLRGVKADLSGVAKPPKANPEELCRELKTGPAWRSGSSGLALGFAPQVQTFGGTTGPEPSSIGAYSTLLYLLCWHGIMAMPPFGVRRGPWTIVGGPLFAAGDVLSWATWEMPLRRQALVGLLGFDAIHAPEPDQSLLAAHRITGVFRSSSRKISTMLSVFGWGERVA